MNFAARSLLAAILFLTLCSYWPRNTAFAGSPTGTDAEAPPAAEPGAPLPNNKVGLNAIRYFDTRYLQAISRIVNSSGGDWGYVSVLFVADDRRDPARIQRFLDDAYSYHLIPIIRLATHMEGNVWVKPGPNEAAEWKSFLVGLRWHTPATYLVVGNEPNLGIEWGGDPSPQEYARYLRSFQDTFSDQRARFRILNAPMDLSNLTQPGMMDDFEFLAAMKAEVPDIFSRLDGWATNPYQFFEGRGVRFTYRGYSQELDFVGIDLPVFVVESYIGFMDDQTKVADYYDTAFNYWLKDPRVVAATPHFYNPEAKLFWMFDADSAGNPINLSPTAQRLLALPKVAGSPNYVAARPEPARITGSISAAIGEVSGQDYAIPNGHFYTQTNGLSYGAGRYGFSITDEGGIPLWSEFQRLGGVDKLGYPISRRFLFDGFVCQATQKFILQWRPERQEVWFVNVFDVLHERGKDMWLQVYRQTPAHPGSAADADLSWDAIMKRHWQILDGDPDLKAFFESDSNPLLHYGLPISMQDMGNAVVLRAQRAVFQKWKEAVPWAPAGYITIANGGDIAKEAGLLPLDATILEAPPTALDAGLR